MGQIIIVACCVIQTTANGVVQRICHTSQAPEVTSQKHIPVPRYSSHRVEFVYINCTSNTNYNQLCSTATDCKAFQLLRLRLHRRHMWHKFAENTFRK